MKLLKKLDLGLLIILGITGIALSVADFLHTELLTDRQAAGIIIAELGLIAASLAAGRFIADERQDSTERALKALAPAQPHASRVFSNGAELEAYLAQRLMGAQREVVDLSWKNTISPAFAAPARQASYSLMNEAIRSAASRVPYREIFVFSDPRRLSRLEDRLSWGSALYSAGYFDRPRPDIPRLQFVVVDAEEALVFSAGQGSALFASKDPALVVTLLAHFNQCWSACTKITDGGRTSTPTLDKIRRKHGTKGAQ